MKRNTIMGAAASALLLAGAVATTTVAHATGDLGKRGAEYVSLGDSFVANGSFFDGRNPQSGCMQAADNVGRLVAKKMPGVSFADWACGGADTEDFTKNTPMGPQIHGLSAKTKYVSISIGGNDESLFSGLIQDCVIGAFCTPQAEQAANAKLARLGPKLDGAYAAVRKAAPNAKVVVLEYLKIMPRSANGCFADVLMGQHGVDVANRTQAKLNETIGKEAAKAGFTVVNAQQPTGHDMCAADGKRYVSFTGVGPKDEGIPIHPTIAGRKYTAALIANAFKA
ncbi:MAG: SGNH/GDSL hydrolase family protein [Gordonia sp. (in: high G+C Gram-positive bacteria)]|uniref:SGNH/GDSL hydrolase family protein n=1 Tax=Gordonia sp. (in: high G+C Gram-positive bacteria) TaxID=84139 RepID=UPI0039E27756